MGISAIVKGDVFIVCSDGLFDMIDDQDIASNATSADKLLDMALTAGGRDNTSIVSIHFGDSEERSISSQVGQQNLFASAKYHCLLT